MLKKTLFLAFTLLFVCNHNIAKAEEITFEKLLLNMENAVASINDYSCKFVTITGESGAMAEFNAMLEKTTGQSLPNEQAMLVWIKKPYMMKTEGPSTDMIFKKEGEDVYGYYWYQKMNTLDRAKMPKNSWPAYPSPEAELVTLKAYLAEEIHDIEKDNKGYILTVSSSESDRKVVYYIDEVSWMIDKRLIYENDKLSMTYEWRDIKLNTGLVDDFFEFQVPDDVKRTVRDLTKTKER